MESFARRLPDFTQPQPYRHSDERFNEVFERLHILTIRMASLAARIHRLEGRGYDE